MPRRKIKKINLGEADSRRRKIVEIILISLMAGLTIAVLFWWFGSRKTHQSQKSSYEIILGDQMDPISEKTAWDKHFDKAGYVYGKEPEPFLKEHLHLLPVGQVIDLACGEGRDMVFLATKGFRVEGVDISEIALRKARRLAQESNVQITTKAADLRTYEISANHYEVVVNMGYLNRDLIPKMYRALKPGGVIVFQNRTVAELKEPKAGVPWRENLLELGEARELLKVFEILVYRETNDTKGAYVSVIGRKPVRK